MGFNRCMPRTLITAYGPYDEWEENASWLALQELLRELPTELDVTTRLYPVDFDEVRGRLEKDLQLGFDLVLHLGQAPGYGRIELESIGINVGIDRGVSPTAFPLAPDGPPAYQSQAPLVEWAERLQAEGIPAVVSYHAGTYLCNAALYLTHYLSERHGYDAQAAFLHLPLDTSQTIAKRLDMASLPSAESARGIRLILEDAAVRYANQNATAEIE